MFSLDGVPSFDAFVRSFRDREVYMRAIVAPFARAAVVLCVVSSSPVSDVVLRACVRRAGSREKFKFRITPRILRATVPKYPVLSRVGGIQPRRTLPSPRIQNADWREGAPDRRGAAKKTFERFLGLLNPRSEPILGEAPRRLPRPPPRFRANVDAAWCDR